MKTEILNDKSALDLENAGKILREGGIVAFATETVYGLGGNALDSNAIIKIFEAKGRPQDNPLIVHISDPSEADKYVYVNELFNKLAKEFMPGPITVILPKRDVICKEVSCGLDSIGIRVPLYAPARELIAKAGIPVAAPSANISGKPSPTKAQHVIDDMNGKVDAILIGDDCAVGVESTVVKITGEDSLVICRPGAVTLEMLKEVCGNVTVDPAVLAKFEGKPVSPGMKYRHYAPKAAVTVLVGTEEQFFDYLKGKADFGVLCFDEDAKLLEFKNSMSLGSCFDLSEQASKLFDCLREFDKLCDVKEIYARMPEKNGVGLAVFNRLLKAAGFNVIEL
ncbi:MAG: threonylcarbamoyl-AMP synthase [Clostridia bacterium]|nr:threonylcarbamoyl-AMP synthase [Clostridia bacterium]